MSNSISLRIQEWVADQLENVSVYDPVTIHIDQLFDRARAETEMMRVCIQAYKILVEQIRAMQTPVQPVLSVPLISKSKRVELAVPNSVQAITHQLAVEPPSLYLLDWNVRKHLLVCERFQAPLPFDLMGQSINGVHTYYLEIRGEIDIVNDWEFARSVRAEYYPARYRR